MDVDTLEIWMIAGLLVDEFGNGARAVAAKRAVDALAEGEMSDHGVWRAVGEAVEAYLSSEPFAAPSFTGAQLPH